MPTSTNIEASNRGTILLSTSQKNADAYLLL